MVTLQVLSHKLFAFEQLTTFPKYDIGFQEKALGHTVAIQSSAQPNSLVTHFFKVLMGPF
jgi:hypothetical protein